MNRKSLLLALSTIGLFTVSTSADSVVTSQVWGPSGIEGFRTRGVTTVESSAPQSPAPVNGDVYQYKVTTDGDILSVNNIAITLFGGAALFNHPFDADNANNRAIPGVEIAFPSMTADSWMDTPGVGFRLGPDLPGDGTTTVGDTSNDGAVTDFIFAQLTVPHGHQFRFEGRISIAGGGGTHVFTQPFSFTTIPEPLSGWLAACALSFLAARRRLRRRARSF